jgi:hypothetical protein
MSDFWDPPNNPHLIPRAFPHLPRWRSPVIERWHRYQFLLGNIDKLFQPKVETLSGHKRKAIKLEEVEKVPKVPCNHLVWHKSYPYCSICLDYSIVKKEDLED